MTWSPASAAGVTPNSSCRSPATRSSGGTPASRRCRVPAATLQTWPATRAASWREKVQVTLLFRGRETSHPEIAEAQMDRVTSGALDVCVVEQPPQLEGRRMIRLLAP